MNTSTGSIPIIPPDGAETIDHERSPRALAYESVTYGTIPELEGSDPDDPGAEPCDLGHETANMVPLVCFKMTMPETDEVPQARERTRAVLATIVVVAVLGSQIAYAFTGVPLDGIYLIMSTGAGALALVLSHYFTARRPKRRIKRKG